MSEVSNLVVRMIKAGNVAEALEVARTAVTNAPNDAHIHYALGQALRFSNDLVGACVELEVADALLPRQVSTLLALAIALQLAGRYPEAIERLRVALDVDPEYVLAINTLGMTQKLMGEYEKAAHNYEAGAFVHGRLIVRAMKNAHDSPRLPQLTTTHDLWLQYAFVSAMSAPDADQFVRLAWPTGEMAERDAVTEEFVGWYWRDSRDQDGARVRLLLPNYFNTFAHEIRRDSTYANLMGNRSTVLGLLGKFEEAETHRQEAEDVISTGFFREA